MITTLLAATLLAQQPRDDGYMRMAHYTAASHKPDEEAPGGFAGSENYPTAIGAVRCRATLRLLLYVDESGAGKLKLSNPTDKEVAFGAEDSALPIVQEAKDAEGVWRPVEFRPPATCGNSYHRLFLPRDHEWTFSTMWDKRGSKTKIRARLLTDSGPIYSNEIDGFVTPKRFQLSPEWAANYEIREDDGIFRVGMKHR